MATCSAARSSLVAERIGFSVADSAEMQLKLEGAKKHRMRLHSVTHGTYESKPAPAPFKDLSETPAHPGTRHCGQRPGPGLGNGLNGNRQRDVFSQGPAAKSVLRRGQGQAGGASGHRHLQGLAEACVEPFVWPGASGFRALMYSADVGPP